MDTELAVLGEQRLLERVAAGDVAAFGKLYDRYAPKVFGLLLRMVRRRSDAEDLLQETFSKVWRDAPRYCPERGRPWVWVGLIARSKALDHLRKIARRGAEGEVREGDAVDPHDASEQLLDRESGELVRGALSRLPNEQGELIRLAFYGGMSHADIAASTGVPIGTVKTRIRLGMRRMKEILSKQMRVAG